LAQVGLKDVRCLRCVSVPRMTLTLLGVMLLIPGVLADDVSFFSVTPLPDFSFGWRVDESAGSITVRLQANTSGWVGFGLAEAGGMAGADILIGWIDSDGEAHISDRWSAGEGLPEEDTCQSWALEPGRSSEICIAGACVTTIVATRSLDTGDSQDRAFVMRNSTKIIVAYGTGDALSWHGVSNRITTEVNIFKEDSEDPSPDPLMALKSDAGIIQATHLVNESHTNGYQVPDGTTYAHFCFDVSSWNTSHIVGFEHIVEPASTAPYVHHFVVKGFLGSPTCSGSRVVVWVWGPGVPAMAFPSQAGLLMGAQNGAFQSLELEIHYDNPSGVTGLLDKSGIRTFRTEALRPYNAGVMQLADPGVELYGQQLPHGISKYAFQCNSDFLSIITAGSSSVTSFGRILHMHQKGKKISSRQYASNGVLRRLSEIEYFNFNYQDMPAGDKETTWEIYADDRFEVDCYYDSGTSNVSFGPGSSDEMCIDFIYYYPYVPTSADESKCTLSSQGHSSFNRTSPSAEDSASLSAFFARNFGSAPSSAAAEQCADPVAVMSMSRASAAPFFVLAQLVVILYSQAAS